MHLVPLLESGPCSNIRAMNLARIRKLRGLSQAELADIVGVDQSTIQRAEAMHQSAKLSTYRLCAEALEVSLADIFTDDRQPVEVEFLRVFRNIPEAKRAELLRVLALAQDPTPSKGQQTDR